MSPEVASLLRRDCIVDPAMRARLWGRSGGGRLSASPTAHAACEVAWVLHGQVEYRIGSRAFVVRAGQAFVVPALIEHATTLAAPMRGGSVWLGAELVEEICEAVGRGSRHMQAGPVPESEGVVTLGLALSNELDAARGGHLVAVRAMTEAIAVAALRAKAEPSRRPRALDPRIAAAIERMHDAYGEPLGVEDLARTAATTRFHFTRLFRDTMGEPPYRYLTRLRLARAAELLRGTRKSVTEVALTVGFSDLARFARAFRREYGENPSLFARRSRAEA
jgi:AraC-like DNA-binding protein